MDGLAYWLFIAALYFLSSLMKRRQQKFARNKLEREDIDADDSDFIDNKTSPAPESMDDFFDQLRNYGKEFLDFEEEDDSDSEVVPDVEMTSKDQAARTLEVRRAIEERMEQRKFKDDLDYLDDDI